MLKPLSENISPGVDHGTRSSAAVAGAVGTGRRALAALRIATGFIFLWTFLDKTFGLGYSTSNGQAWIRGGSPTQGFLSSVDVGPFQPVAHAIAGAWWADWLFMLGMLGVGVAVMAGVALRPAAVAGTLMLAMIWLTEFPPAQVTSSGHPSGSMNPIVDPNVIYATALIVLAATSAGTTWGLNKLWTRLPFIHDHRWTH